MTSCAIEMEAMFLVNVYYLHAGHSDSSRVSATAQGKLC